MWYKHTCINLVNQNMSVSGRVIGEIGSSQLMSFKQSCFYVLSDEIEISILYLKGDYHKELFLYP